MKRPLIVAAVACLALSAVGTTVAAPSKQAAPATARFVSPTRNIQCVYMNQWGIGCRTANNGRVAVLHAYTGAVTFQGWYHNPWTARLGPWYGRYSYYSRVISYGYTVAYGGTFRVHSDRRGFDVWSTLTHRGFRINRDAAWRR